MGLNDLMSEIKQDQSCFLGDEPVEIKVLNQVLALVEDKISEVKNQAVKWYDPPSLSMLQCKIDSIQSGAIDQDYPTTTDGNSSGQADRLFRGAR